MKFSAKVIGPLSITFILVLLSGCNKDSVTEPAKDTEKPTVSILFPAAGADVKADTTYTVIADANDNMKVTKVEFYISGQNSATDTLSPFEYRWNTQGLTGSQTIMAKAYDASGNIGTSSVISVAIKGVANHAPVAPYNPSPANGATEQSRSLTLTWSCSDPDGDALTYDVYFATSNPPSTLVATNQSARNINQSGLSDSTTYYWKIVAKDSKGATTTGSVWSFTTAANRPPAVPSNPSPTSAATGISTSPALSWSCSDPEGDAITYDLFFDTSNPPTAQVATGQSATTLSRTGLANSTTYYWKVNAKDSKGATTMGTVWSFTTSSGGGSVPAEMVAVAGGTFQMGSTLGTPDEIPVHSVTLGGFYIDKTEITYEKWTDVRNWGLTHGYTDLVAGRNGYTGTTKHPVTEVSWYDILKWCNARSEKDGLTPVYYTSNTLSTVYRTGQLDLAADAVKWTANGYRLPTEAEWEFAARGGTKSQGATYSGSNIIDDVTWYSSNSGNNTHAVGTKGANELGLYDMSGNVWEWSWDWYGAYSSTAQTDPKGPTSGTYRVLRGGSFNFIVNFCRVAFRVNYPDPYFRYYDDGFRCVQD